MGRIITEDTKVECLILYLTSDKSQADIRLGYGVRINELRNNPEVLYKAGKEMGLERDDREQVIQDVERLLEEKTYNNTRENRLRFKRENVRYCV